MDKSHAFGAFSDDYSDRLRTAKEAIVSGGDAGHMGIPEYLVESWRRSHGFGIHPSDQLLASPDSQLFLIDDQDRYLSAVVGQAIDSIWNSFGGENWVVYVTNEEGVIIRARHGSNPASRSFALQVGRRLSESDIGTTAPSCALQERRPLTLVGAEHYLSEFSRLFCCAVPIWGPWGTVMGVMNITGSEEFKSSLVEKKLFSAAVKVENRLFMDAHRSNQVIRIHYDFEFIDTHHAGLVAINGYGDILSLTRCAAEMLDNIDPFHQRCNLADLFLDDLLIDGQCFEAQLKNGIVFYTRGMLPGSGADISAPFVVRKMATLRDRSELHILETLAKTKGNVSKAAQILGVSRNTLYRVLKKHD
ncbi:helix-turn-helix domain-containing protein [Pseudomonas sp. XS1P51]